jgi:hypothetical protein
LLQASHTSRRLRNAGRSNRCTFCFVLELRAVPK